MHGQSNARPTDTFPAKQHYTYNIYTYIINYMLNYMLITKQKCSTASKIVQLGDKLNSKIAISWNVLPILRANIEFEKDQPFQQ